MIEANENVPDADAHEVEAGRPEARAGRVERERPRIGAQYMRARSGAVDEEHEAAMRGVGLEQQTVLERDCARSTAALDLQLEHCVAAVAMAGREQAGASDRTWRAGGGDAEARQHVRLDRGTLCADLEPGDFAVPIAIEPYQEFKIFEVDIPLNGRRPPLIVILKQLSLGL